MTGGLLEIVVPLAVTPKRGQREVAGEFSVSDSEGMVFEVVGHRVVLSLENKEGLAFDEEEALKEAIVILASATVQNGAALAQPRRGVGTERSMCWFVQLWMPRTV